MLLWPVPPAVCLQAGRWVLSCLGRISDQECTEESGLPDFPLAVRTQLLVGETSYAIQAQPSYAAAFSKTQDIGEVMVQVRHPSRDGLTAQAQPCLLLAHLATWCNPGQDAPACACSSGQTQAAAP